MPRINVNDADFSLTCVTCGNAESESAGREDRAMDREVGELNGGGNNLSRHQASARASAHLRKYPGHDLFWTAMGSVEA